MKSQSFTKAELIEQNDNLRTKVANLEYKLANHHFPESSTIISQNDFSAILENNADGILIIDEEGIVMYVNPAAEMIFDRKKKEFIGIQFGFPLTNEGLQEIVIFKKGGLYVEAELRLVPITWRNKPGYQLSVRDISQRKIEEEERIKNETLIKAAVDNLPIIFYIIDAEGKFRLSIGAGLKRLKLISNEVVGKSVFDVYKNSPAIVNAIEKSLKGDNVNFESRVGNASYDNYVVPYSGTNELFNGVLGVALDITERKEAEQHLKESEIMFRDLFTRMSEGFAYHEVIYNAHHKAVDYKILEVNQGFENHTGISVKEAKGALASQLYGTKSAPYLDVYSKVASSGEYKILEYYFPPLDRYFEISVFSSEPGYFATIFTNITQRKKTEQELRYNENRLKSIFDTVGDIIFLIDVEKDGEYRFATVNQMFSNATGVPKELIIGKRVRDVIPEPSLTLALSKYKEAIKGKNIVRWEDTTRYPSITLTGETSVVPMFDGDGNCIHLVVAVHDITQRTKAEDEVKNSEIRYRRLFESAKDGILILNADDGVIVDVNPYLTDLLGYSRDRFLGKKVWELGPFRDIYKNQEKYFELQQEEYIRYEDLPLETINGKRIDVEFVSNVYLVNNEKVIQCNIRNITDRKRAEEAIEREHYLLQTLIDNLPEYIYVKDLKGRFIAGNSALIRQVGMKSREDIIGKTDYDFFPKALATRYRDEEKKMLMTGKGIYDYEGPTLDEGEERWVSTTKVPIRDINGKISGFVGLGRDITEHRKSEQDLRLQSAALQAAANAIVITDIDGKIQWVNHSFCTLTGFSDIEAVGKNPRELVYSGEHSTDFYRKLWATILAGNTWKGEMINKKKDGSQYFEEMTINPLKDPDGKISHFIAIKQDITERKNANSVLRENEVQLQRAQSVAHIGSWNTDLTNNRLTWSPETYRIFGLPQDLDLTFEKFLSSVYPDDRDNITRSSLALTNGAPYNIDHRIIANGEVKWVREIAEMEFDPDGKPIRKIGTVQDITLQKMADEKIHLLNSDLEDRIVQRTRQLVEANKEMEAFAYSVSHDLRAPLRAINGYSEILKSQYHDKMDDEGKRVIDTVIRNALRMGQLIDDLLEFSRLGRHNLVMSSVDMQKMLEEVVNDITMQEKDRKIEIKINPLSPCTADPSMIRQVWINLVGNAFKYSKKKESAHIEIGSYPENGSICYYVKDNGTGFNMKYINKLFNVFQRLHSMDEFEGTGVGLALVKRIVTRHGGIVWAEGKTDEGATFYFSLPDRPASEKS